jgi:hypothetical protein
MRTISTWPKKYLPDNPYNIHNPFQDNYLINKYIYKNTIGIQIWLKG